MSESYSLYFKIMCFYKLLIVKCRLSGTISTDQLIRNDNVNQKNE